MLDRAITGVYRYPTVERLGELAQPRDEETDQQARRRVIDEFGEAAAEIDRRTAATMTASGFALAINGVLLKSGPTSRNLLLVLAIPALIAFAACFFSFLVWVDRGPGADDSFENLDDARATCIVKQFWTFIAMVMAVVALELYGAALMYLALAG